jgi:uncharacterized protein YcbK (DUF882 family)
MTKNFNKHEFDSKDGSTMPRAVEVNIFRLAENLEVLRNYIECPIKINSGYRSPSWNAERGGVSNSQHVKGNAADLVTLNFTPKQLYAIIEELIINGWMDEGGLGLYDTFVHYDRRGTRARWNKTT